MTKKQKILFITATYSLRSGGERSNFELIKGAKKRGYDVRVVVQQEADLTDALTKEGIPYTIIPYYWSKWLPSPGIEDAGLVNFAAVGLLCRYINEEVIDCVVTNTMNVPWGALAAAITNTPHAWIARESAENEFEYLKGQYAFVNNYSNLLIANSRELAEYMRKKQGLSKTRHFFSYVDESSLALNHNIQETRIVVLGDMHRRKNQIELINALAIMNKTGVLNTKAILIGDTTVDPSYYREVQELIAKKGLEDIVQITGHNPSPYSSIGPNDVMVQTSRAESIGRVLTESMKLGLICVGADIPGTTEAFKLGGGTLYKSGNHKNLARVLGDVLNNIEEHKQRALAAQMRALKNMSEDECNKPFFKSLTDIIGKPNLRPEIGFLEPFIVNVSELADKNAKLIRDYHYALKDTTDELGAIKEHIVWRVLATVRAIRVRLFGSK